MKKSMMSQEAAEWASAALVFVCGATAGHYAQAGMNMTQWAGAVVAVLGSITVAVAVRVWPEKTASQKAERD
ncbi:MAG: hypothetical protein ACK4YQ_18390 [Phenylobacterium sp.]|uniref:hypothetical protein n=1 Tax=Phenylobacterium sp. TaxID=1871053 RepID=UPI00391BFA0D